MPNHNLEMFPSVVRQIMMSHTNITVLTYMTVYLTTLKTVQILLSSNDKVSAKNELETMWEKESKPHLSC
jgi:hypothetical protein